MSLKQRARKILAKVGQTSLRDIGSLFQLKNYFAKGLIDVDDAQTLIDAITSGIVDSQIKESIRKAQKFAAKKPEFINKDFLNIYFNLDTGRLEYETGIYRIELPDNLLILFEPAGDNIDDFVLAELTQDFQDFQDLLKKVREISQQKITKNELEESLKFLYDSKLVIKKQNSWRLVETVRSYSIKTPKPHVEFTGGKYGVEIRFDVVKNKQFLRDLVLPEDKVDNYTLILQRGPRVSGLYELFKEKYEYVILGGYDPSFGVPEKDVPTERSLNDLSSFFAKDLEEYEKFRGNYLYEWGWLLYLEELLQKEGKVSPCVWSKKRNKTDFYYNTSKQKLTIEPDIVKSIRGCISTGAEFVVGLSTLILPRGRHANSIIFDTRHQTLTRYEPHGATSKLYNQEPLDRLLMKWVRRTFGRKWKYLSPSDFCPNPGPQTRDSYVNFKLKTKKVFGRTVKAEAGGFCQAWALLYIHFRITNPDLTDQEVSDHILSWTDKELSVKIRKYTEYIVSKVFVDDVINEKKKEIEPGDVIKYYQMIRGKNIEHFGIVNIIKRKNMEINRYLPEKGIFIPRIISILSTTLVEDEDKIKEIRRLKKKFDEKFANQKIAVGDMVKIRYRKTIDVVGFIKEITAKKYILNGVSIRGNKVSPGSKMELMKGGFQLEVLTKNSQEYKKYSKYLSST